jgi:hypothetical protein
LAAVSTDASTNRMNFNFFACPYGEGRFSDKLNIVFDPKTYNNIPIQCDGCINPNPRDRISPLGL